MIAYREPDGLDRTVIVLASAMHEVRTEALRRKVQAFNLVFFGAIFAALVLGETFFASMMFSIIQVEIMGRVFSGAAFAMLVPTVICAAHVKLHHEADHFTRWWLGRLSSIGIPIFAIGVSLTIGFSAWQAAEDVMSATAAGPIGTLGSASIGGDDSGSSGIAGWIAVIPHSLLFAGLSFGMIITIWLASFCLGRALQAFNILTQVPRIADEVRTRIEAATAEIAAFRKLHDRDTAARRKLPFDVKAKFAREAAHAGWQVVQTKLAAARRKFDPARGNDPLATVIRDAEADTIPSRFKTYEEFAQHMAEQMDSLRMHNLVRVLSGIPKPERTRYDPHSQKRRRPRRSHRRNTRR